MDLGLSVSSDGNEAFQLPTPKIEDIKEEEYDHMITCQDDEEEEKPLTELFCKTESLGSNEASQATAEFEVKLEDDEDEEEDHDDEDEEYQDDDSPQGGASKYPHGTQQNDELNLHLLEGLYHSAVCRKSFTALKELEKHQKRHFCVLLDHICDPARRNQSLW
ncbi:hypothetical protein AALO_G00091400 [Alosa alosa]|uniref:C2H2-type domain-containing protein n=1 Tax=Alosa alosa TaxID=278164 RepID=A0AAV6GRF2_9TELE|nr:hypothetical protein AALO_G00091400 [Alosa alosa]